MTSSIRPDSTPHVKRPSFGRVSTGLKVAAIVAVAAMAIAGYGAFHAQLGSGQFYSCVGLGTAGLIGFTAAVVSMVREYRDHKHKRKVYVEAREATREAREARHEARRPESLQSDSEDESPASTKRRRKLRARPLENCDRSEREISGSGAHREDDLSSSSDMGISSIMAGFPKVDQVSDRGLGASLEGSLGSATPSPKPLRELEAINAEWPSQATTLKDYTTRMESFMALERGDSSFFDVTGLPENRKQFDLDIGRSQHCIDGKPIKTDKKEAEAIRDQLDQAITRFVPKEEDISDLKTYWSGKGVEIQDAASLYHRYATQGIQSIFAEDLMLRYVNPTLDNGMMNVAGKGTVYNLSNIGDKRQVEVVWLGEIRLAKDSALTGGHYEIHYKFEAHLVVDLATGEGYKEYHLTKPETPIVHVPKSTGVGAWLTSLFLPKEEIPYTLELREDGKKKTFNYEVPQIPGKGTT